MIAIVVSALVAIFALSALPVAAQQQLPLDQSLCPPSVEDSWFSTQVAILISPLSAAIFAIVAMRTQVYIARRRATLDMMMRKEWDSDYILAKREFNKLRDNLIAWVEQGKRNSAEA